MEECRCVRKRVRERSVRPTNLSKAHRKRFDVRTMCRVLEVAPSGYYAWLQEPVCQRALEDVRLLAVDPRLVHGKPRYLRSATGIPRPSGGRRDLQQAPSGAADARKQNPSGPRISNPAQLRIQALRADPKRPSAQVRCREPEQGLGYGYIRTWEGWLYLAVVMDLFSRKIVGWSTRPTIARELVLDAVLMAVRRRRPRGAVIHSDQGFAIWQRRLAEVLQNKSS